MAFFLSLFGYFLLSVVTLLDDVVITKEKQSPLRYTFYSIVIFLPLLGFLAFFPAVFSLSDLLLGLGSGIVLGISYFTGYQSYVTNEVSHLGPFGGGVFTLSTLILSFLFLGEQLTPVEYAGVVILVVASLLLSIEKTRKKHATSVGFWWMGLSAALFAATNVARKFLYVRYPFTPVLLLTTGSAGIVGIALLSFRDVRTSLALLTAKKKKRHSLRQPGTVIVVDKALGFVAVLAIQLATALGSVTIVNALSGLQYAFLFFLVYALTQFRPKLFREFFTKKEFELQAIAVALLLVGSLIMVL